MKSVGLRAKAFATPQDFLTRKLPDADGPSCLVLDVRLPVEFLTKLFRDQDLLDAIQQARQREREPRRQQREIQKLKERYETLTARERDVMGLLVSGMLTKQVAARLGTSEIAAQVHRGQVMRKMHANSRRLMAEAGLSPACLIKPPLYISITVPIKTHNCLVRPSR